MQPPLQINPNNVKITRQTPITSAGLGCGSKVRLFEASNLALRKGGIWWDGLLKNWYQKGSLICVHYHSTFNIYQSVTTALFFQHI